MFDASEYGIEETSRAGFAWAGAAEPRHWSRRAQDVAFPDAAGLVDAVLAALRPGDRLLVDAPALATFDAYLLDPERDPITDPIGEENIVPTGLAKLQEWLLKEIGERFRLETVCRGADGLRVVVLEPRGGRPAGGS